MGGQKTMGAIHGEAYNFLKKNYVTMLVITLVIAGIGLVLGTVTSLITAPLSGVAGMFAPLFAIRENYTEPFEVLSALVPMLSLIGIIVMISMVIGVAEGIAASTAEVGAKNATLQLLTGVKPTFAGVWGNFSKNWKRYLGITAWSLLWTVLWGLLLIVPGYIKSLSYRFAPYLMIQYPDMKVRDALKKSMEITRGYKGRLFGLDVIMFGYGLGVAVVSMICCFLMGLPILASLFWLPLLQYSMNGIAYLDIRQAAIEKGLLTAEG